MKFLHYTVGVVMIAASLCGCGRRQSGEFPVKDGSVKEMSYSASGTEFSLWAPSADSVRLHLYHDGLSGGSYRDIDMSPSEDGAWRTEVKEDLKGDFYTFQVCVDGIWMDETAGIFAVATGPNGHRAAVVDMEETSPEGWSADKSPELESFADIVIYEVHHRDFSVAANSGIDNKGKFLAMTESGTANTFGEATGLDHLKELGITHVHLLPSFDYASVDETRPEDKVYNWGYDPVNYNVPEGSYSTDPADPSVRIREFKKMVMSLHEAGIRVIMDVVYNHLSDAASSCFELTVPGYFFRHREDGTYADASGCGNETASETAMMRKFMVESVKYWAEEYHIDGFRFDLMGIHDIETMNAIRAALDEVDPTIFIYGEGWAASSPVLDADLLAMKANTYKMKGIAAFSDELRDALRGPFNDDTKPAFLAALPGNVESLKFGIAGAVEHPMVDLDKVNYTSAAWAGEPSQMISYVSCHDDMCLRDRLYASIPDLTLSEALALDKLAQTTVFVSQGVPFIYAGEELFRTKKGIHNSYNAPDEINEINWDFKHEYSDLFEYYAGLVALRKAHPALRLGNAEAVRSNLVFLPGADESLLAFSVSDPSSGDSLVVILNASSESAAVNVPAGSYKVLCESGKIGLDGLRSLDVENGGTVLAAGQAAMILSKE